MAISDKLSYLNTTKGLIKDSLNNLGAEISSADTFRSYATTIDDLYNEWPKVSGEGTLVTLLNVKKGRMPITINGNTIQSGTPTSYNPVDIHVVSGENNVVVCGENLCNGINQGYFINITGTECGKTGADIGLAIPVFGGEYTVSTTSTQARYRVGCVNTLPTSSITETIYNGVAQDGNDLPIIIDTTGYKYLVVNVTDLTKIQIKKLSTASTYETYTGTTYQITLPTGMELRKTETGDDRDYIYPDNNKWYWYKGVGKVVLDGSETITRATTSVSGEYRFGIEIPNCKKGLDIPLKSTHFDNTLLSTYSNRGIGGRTDVNGFFINDVNLCQMTEAQFKTWLSNNNPEVIYPLATPTTTEITDRTLVNQLDDLYNAMALEGTNNIFSEYANAPIIINANALLKGSA